MITRQRYNQFFVLASLFVVLAFFILSGFWVLQHQKSQTVEAQIEAALVSWGTGEIESTQEYTNPHLYIDTSDIAHFVARNVTAGQMDYGYCDLSSDCTSDSNWTIYSISLTDQIPYGIDENSSGDKFVLSRTIGGGNIAQMTFCLDATGCDEVGDWSSYALSTTNVSNGALAIGSDDNLHISLSSDDGSGNSLVYSNCLEVTGCDAITDWTTFDLENTAGTDFFGATAIDIELTSSNNPHILYSSTPAGAANDSIGHAYCLSMFATSCDEFSDWSLSTIIADQSSGVTDVAFVLNEINDFSVVYSDTTTDLFYLTCEISTACNALGDWSAPFSFDSSLSSGSLDMTYLNGEVVAVYSVISPSSATLSAECSVASGCDALGEWDIKTINADSAFSASIVDNNQDTYAIYPEGSGFSSRLQFSVGAKSPEVKFTDPTQNKRNADSTSTFVQVQFDKPMTPASASQSTLPFFANGRRIGGSYNIGGITLTNDTFTFIPSDDFPVGQRVMYTATDGLLDSDANAAIPYVGSFVTEATTGSAKFSSHQAYTASSEAFPGIISTDVDNDGDIDIVTSQGGTRVFINNGNGIFADGVAYSSGGGGARGNTFGDYNNDGFVDIATANSSSDTFGVNINNGDGTFAAGVTYATGDDPRDGGSADLNGDGYLDIVFPNRSDADISVFLNNGDGTFAAKVDYQYFGGMTLANSVRLGDVDNDGDIDIFASAQSTGAVLVFENQGDGTFIDGTSAVLTAPYYIEIGDFNGDNFLDVVSGGTSGPTNIQISLNDGAGNLQAASNYSLGGGVLGVGIGDFDADGDLDVVGGLGGTTDNLAYVLNNGSGSFGSLTTFPTGGNNDPNGVTVADFNGDGALDFAYVAQIQTVMGVVLADASPTIEVIQPNGGETITPNSTYIIQWSGQDDSGGIDLIDLEFDSGGGFSAIPGATGLSTHTFNYPFKQQIGSTGSGDGQWWFGPYFLAVDSSGNVYGPDQTLHQIDRFNSDGVWQGCLDSTASGYVSSGCGVSSGSGDGQFIFPYGVAVDGNDNLFVAEQGNSRIQKFDSSGNFLLKWGSGGSGNGQFNVLQSIAVDSLGNVYVMDRDNRRIQKFDNNGGYITQWGSDGAGDGQFSIANQYIAVDSDDNVWASGQNRVQKFSNTGTFLGCLDSSASGLKVSGCLTSTGEAPGQFTSNQGVYVDDSGNIFVVDAGNDRIQKFDSSGEFLLEWGENGSGTGQFNFPYAITGRPNGNILVGDPNNKRISEFSPIGEFIWSVPDITTTSGQIRITADDGITAVSQDTSDAVFTIGDSGGGSRQTQQIINQQQSNTQQEQSESSEDTDTTDTTEEINEVEDDQSESDDSNDSNQQVEEPVQDTEESEEETEDELIEEEQELVENETPEPNEEMPVEVPTEEETKTIEPTIRELILQTPGIDQGEETPEEEVIETPEFSLQAEFTPVESGLNYEGTTDLFDSVVSVTINKQVTKLINTNEQGEWMSFVSAAELGLVPGEVKQVVFDIVAANESINSNRVSKTLTLYLAKDGKTVTELVSADDIPLYPMLPKELIMGGLGAIAALLIVMLSLYHMIIQKQKALMEGEK